MGGGRRVTAWIIVLGSTVGASACHALAADPAEAEARRASACRTLLGALVEQTAPPPRTAQREQSKRSHE